ncbi:MAG: hypothetical protein R2867_37900 [Caldilineaceae bacterium]
MTFYYGMISGSGSFPRGPGDPARRQSVPPVPLVHFNLGCGWDSDGSYADWYAGHEMGHSLGRAHPAASAALCGNSASDNSYPYPNGQIGPNGGSMEGFDRRPTTDCAPYLPRHNVERCRGLLLQQPVDQRLHLHRRTTIT